MIKRDETGEYVGIQCDQAECPTMAPPADQVMKGHGLNNMGWHCWGGSHFCPDHVTDDMRTARAQVRGNPALGSRHE